MDFSHTFIAIRRRSLLGLFDLSLLVYRDHALSILTLLAINALPWLVFDVLILMFSEFATTDYGQWHWKLVLLAVLQAQYGTMMITLYLGKASLRADRRFPRPCRRSLKLRGIRSGCMGV